MRSKLLALVVASSLTLTLAACGGDSDGGGDATPTTTTPTVDLAKVTFEDQTGKAAVTIKAVDNNFEPQYVTVSPGTTVSFENAGRNKHNVMPVDTAAFTDIKVDDFAPGTTVEVQLGTKKTFDEPGDYPYYCTLHGTVTKGMTGAIRVADK